MMISDAWSLLPLVDSNGSADTTPSYCSDIFIILHIGTKIIVFSQALNNTSAHQMIKKFVPLTTT